MPWGLSTRQRIEALDEKVEALSDRLNELVSRIGDLSADHDRLSSEVDQTKQSLEAATVDVRDQAEQLSAVRCSVEELQTANRQAAELTSGLQESNGTLSDAVADLQEHHRNSSGLIAEHAVQVAGAQERSAQQGKSIEQICADLTRLERQAATDMAELRATDAALARVVLKATNQSGAAAS